MALVNLIGLLGHARRNGYGVGAFNVPEYESLQAILDAAVERDSPVIIDVAEVHLKYIDLEDVAHVVTRAAERAPIPVALHLDHGETFGTIVRAIRAGFSSIMFDGSHLSFEENIAQTAEVVKICHACGVSVEAELGRVGGAEGAGERSEADRSLFTDPVEAGEFVDRTGIDALAIAFGTAHGLYKGVPELDFPRLEEIARRAHVPVVLHGGTGVRDEDFRKAISLGIAKINYYTQTSVAAVEGVRSILASEPELISYPDLLQRARRYIQEEIERQMDVFGSSGICLRHPDLCTECETCVPPSRQIGTPSDAPQDGPAGGSEAADVEGLVEAVTRAVIAELKEKP